MKCVRGLVERMLESLLWKWRASGAAVRVMMRITMGLVMAVEHARTEQLPGARAAEVEQMISMMSRLLQHLLDYVVWRPRNELK